MTGYAKNGNDLDNLLEPWQSGDGYAAATGYKINGADLNTRYAPASVGTAYTGGAGYNQNGSDIGPRFAAKGSRVSTLGFDGNSYSSFTTRSAAQLTLKFDPGGTWSITDQGGAVQASGPWLTSGTASEYAVQFVMSGFTAGPDISGGTDNYSNGATSASSLTSSRSAWASASAITVGNDARNSGTVTAKLYRSGVLINTSTCNFDVRSTGV